MFGFELYIRKVTLLVGPFKSVTHSFTPTLPQAHYTEFFLPISDYVPASSLAKPPAPVITVEEMPAAPPAKRQRTSAHASSTVRQQPRGKAAQQPLEPSQQEHQGTQKVTATSGQTEATDAVATAAVAGIMQQEDWQGAPAAAAGSVQVGQEAGDTAVKSEGAAARDVERVGASAPRADQADGVTNGELGQGGDLVDVA